MLRDVMKLKEKGEKDGAKGREFYSSMKKAVLQKSRFYGLPVPVCNYRFCQKTAYRNVFALLTAFLSPA